MSSGLVTSPSSLPVEAGTAGNGGGAAEGTDSPERTTAVPPSSSKSDSPERTGEDAAGDSDIIGSGAAKVGPSELFKEDAGGGESARRARLEIMVRKESFNDRSKMSCWCGSDDRIAGDDWFFERLSIYAVCSLPFGAAEHFCWDPSFVLTLRRAAVDITRNTECFHIA